MHLLMMQRGQMAYRGGGREGDLRMMHEVVWVKEAGRACLVLHYHPLISPCVCMAACEHGWGGGSAPRHRPPLL